MKWLKSLIIFILGFSFFSCQNDPEYFYKKGNSFFMAGNYYRAIELYTKAVMSKNKFPEAICARGLAYEKLGDKQKAIYEYEKAISVDKTYLPAYNNLASIYIEGKNYKDAIYYLNEALKQNPNYYYGYYSRGLCYYYTGNYEYAYNDFSKAYEIEKKEQALYYKALSASKLANYKEAISCLDELISSNPKNEILLFQRGKNKLEINDISAENDLAEAIKINDRELYRYYYSKVLFSKRDFNSALDNILKAIDMSKEKKAEYFYFAGDIYLLLCNKEKAMEMYDTGFELDGNTRLYNSKKTELKKFKCKTYRGGKR